MTTTLEAAYTKATKAAAERTFTATGKAKDGRPVLFNLNELNLDLSYQFDPATEPGRQAALKRWMEKKGGFDPVEAGPIHVNIRTKGDYNGQTMRGGEQYVMDGGGRCDMARRSGLKQILGIPTDGLLYRPEMEFFIDKNRHSRRITPPHLFVVAANIGHEPEATIMRHMREAKYVPYRAAGKGAVLATSALKFSYALGENVLRMSLLDMRSVWGDEEVDGRHLVSTSVIRALYPSLDQRRFRDCLRDYEKGSAAALINQARSQAFAVVSKTRNPQSRDTNPHIVMVMMGLYNFRKGHKPGLRMEPNFERLRERFVNQNEYWGVWSFVGDRAPKRNGEALATE